MQSIANQQRRDDETQNRHTRTHILDASTSEIARNWRLGRQPKVCNIHLGAVFGAKHILRLDVAVVHAVLVAKRNGVDELQKGDLDFICATDEIVALHDSLEKVTAAAEIEDNVAKISVGVQKLVKGDDIGMMGYGEMVREFAELELLFKRAQLGNAQALYGKVGGIGYGRGRVKSAVDLAIGACTDAVKQPETTGVDNLACKVGHRVCGDGSGHSKRDCQSR